MNGLRTFLAVTVVSCALSGSLPAAGFAQSATARDSEIAGPTQDEHGAWRSKVQQVFDPATRTLSRRLYVVWDLVPTRDLVFSWSPDRPSVDKPGKINGTGRLTWRVKGKPAYDRSAVVAEYRGSVRNGRIAGYGTYLDHTGLLYEGGWEAGRMHGRGALTLASGDEYIGQFRDGKAEGTGHYIDITGEIYEGPFVEGRRHGRGRTTLPNGRTYVSFWTEGVETERSRFIRLAQGPGARLPGGADDIRIGIMLDKRLPPSSRTDDPYLRNGDLWYKVSNTSGGFAIRPDKKRLMSLWKEGGELQILPKEEEKQFDNFGVFSLVKGQLVPLSLIVEVQNRSSSRIEIAGMYLEVDSSVSDLQPAIQMSRDSAFATNDGEGDDDVGSAYQPSYFIENFGWGTAKEARLRYGFVKPGTSAETILSYTYDIGTVERSSKVNFEAHLRKAGVDVSTLKRKAAERSRFRCKSRTASACLVEIKKSALFGSLTNYIYLDQGVFEATIEARVTGRLEYAWTDSAGKTNKAVSPFNIRLPLGRLPSSAEQGEGAAREIITRVAQQFKLDTSHYRLPVSYQSNIAAGQTSRFVLPLDAEKSSRHDFSVVIQLSDGREIKSRPINLLYYRPKWFARSTFKTSAQEFAETARLKYDLPGNDLRELRDIGESACGRACDDEASCNAYTFDRWNRLCFLKTAASEMRFDPQYNSGLKEGTQAPTATGGAKVIEGYRNTVFPGYGYMIEQGIDFDTCGSRCIGDESCIAFTFRKKDQSCHLLDDVETYESNAETDSGVKRQPAK
jgi:hypothetical protein